MRLHVATVFALGMALTLSATAQDPSDNSPTHFEGFKRLARIQFLSNISALADAPTYFPRHDGPAEFNWNAPRPTPLARPDVEPRFGSPLGGIMGPLRNFEAYMSESIGLQFGVYYTALWQNVFSPEPGHPRNFGTSRIDFNLIWNLFNNEEHGHGLIGFLAREGNQIGVDDTATTSASVGSTQGLNSLYTGASPGQGQVYLLYYQQGWDDDRFVVSAGKVHPNQYIGLNYWANDESRQFLAGPFDGIQPLGSSMGGYQLGVALQVIPTDGFFLNGIITDALGQPDTDFSTFDEGFYWGALEAGFLLPWIDAEAAGGPSLLSVIWSNTNLYGAPSSGIPAKTTSHAFLQSVWDTAAVNDSAILGPIKSTSNALALQLQGHFSSNFGYFAQWAICEPDMATTEQQFSCGIGIHDPLGHKGEMFGVAFNWSKPSSSFDNVLARSGLRSDEQSMIEMFYRIQLTSSCQLTPDIQIVLDPGASVPLDKGPTVIFGLRLRTDF